MKTYVKDPQAELDYKFDWAPLTNEAPGAVSDWLASGETIESYTLTIAGGITNVSDSRTDSNTSVTVWLSGGSAGREYRVTCHIVTSAWREDDRTIVVKVRQR